MREGRARYPERGQLAPRTFNTRRGRARGEPPALRLRLRNGYYSVRGDMIMEFANSVIIRPTNRASACTR